jgi:hypothetical protein
VSPHCRSRNQWRRTGLCERPDNTFPEENNMGRGVILWLLGIPLPIILLIWLFGGLH